MNIASLLLGFNTSSIDGAFRIISCHIELEAMKQTYKRKLFLKSHEFHRASLNLPK